MFAVFFAVTMRSIQIGAWDRMVESVVSFYFGYAQIHTQGYWDEQSLEKAFSPDAPEILDLGDVKGVNGLVPRLESFALASYGDKSKGAFLIGVDAEMEQELTDLQSRVIAGEYLNNGGVLLAEGLAEYLGMQVRDTIVFISQGYHGINAAGKYEVSGIVRFGSPDLNKQMAFMHLADAQWFYGAENLVTSLIISTSDPDNIKSIVAGLGARLDPEKYEVLDYEQLLPDIVEARALDEAGGVIVLSILYAIIAFGIFGTMLMMLKERQYELGILKTIGMHTRQLNWMIWMETAMLGLVGTLAGALLALPLVVYLNIHPIRFTGEMAEAYEKFGVEAVMPAAIDPGIFLAQAVAVLVMISVMSLYPFFKIKTLDAVSAMRG